MIAKSNAEDFTSCHGLRATCQVSARLPLIGILPSVISTNILKSVIQNRPVFKWLLVALQWLNVVFYTTFFFYFITLLLQHFHH